MDNNEFLRQVSVLLRKLTGDNSPVRYATLYTVEDGIHHVIKDRVVEFIPEGE